MRWRRALRRVAAVEAGAALACWLALGAHRGWTHTSVPIARKDPVTDQDYVVWQNRFEPGVDFLAAAGIVALALGLASLVVPKGQSSPTD